MVLELGTASATGIVTFWTYLMFDYKSLLTNRVRQSGAAQVSNIFKAADRPGVISLSGGLPNPKFFPIDKLIAATEKVMRADGHNILQYGGSEGYLPLRKWVAERYCKQGVEVVPEMVVMTSGSLQGMDITGRTFIEPGDTVLIEAPAFVGAIQTLLIYQPRFVGVPVAADGVDVQALGRAISENPGAKLFEACPSFQNPSGVLYSQAARDGVAAVVRDQAILVVEDDPYAELRFDGSQPVSLRRELGDQCITLGSFSKIVSPGMRVGWTVASRALAPYYALGKQTTDSHASNFAQAVIWQFLMDNDIDAHIAGINATYKIQRDAMITAIAKYFPPEVKTTVPLGGMFIWATMPDDSDAMKMFHDAVDHDLVAVVPGGPFYTDGKHGNHQFRMSYSTVEPGVIEEGIRRLGRALARHLDAPSAS